MITAHSLTVVLFAALALPFGALAETSNNLAPTDVSNHAAQNTSISISNTSENAFCYTPSRSNTSFSTLLESETDTPNSVIQYGEQDLQFAELWLPPASFLNSSKGVPLVIFVHGGCWLNAYDIEHSHALSTGLSRSGYAVWSIEYRRTGDAGGGWPGSFDDVALAIRFGLNDLGKHSEMSQNIDFENVSLLGHSAGGHLGLLAAAEPDIRDRLKQAIGLAAIVDLKLYSQDDNSCAAVTEQFMGASAQDEPEAYLAASLVGKNLPKNTIMMIGSEDTIVSAKQAQLIAYQTAEIQGAGHFDFIDPHSWAFNALLKILGATESKP